MATNRSMENMLNENVYARIQAEKEDSNELMSAREKIRNEFIDKMGRKPTEEEIDIILTQQATSAV